MTYCFWPVGWGVRAVASAGTIVISALILSSVLASTSAQANPLAYATTGDDQFGVVDLTTGVFTETGNMGVRLTGLGVGPGGALYGGGYASGTLYTVNPSNGALTIVGSGSLTYWAIGSTTSGLFAVDNSPNMNLYSIDPSTGAATLIGPTGLSPSATVEGMSTGSSTLYLTRNSSLYSLDTTTGIATLIGTSPLGLFGPMVVEHGFIFDGATDPSAIWLLSDTDGFGIFQADTTGADTNFWGLAPDTTPIPAALPLFATGLGALGLFGWRRMRTLAIAA